MSELVDELDLGSSCIRGGVPELVDGRGLGPRALGRRGSSPRFPTGNLLLRGGKPPIMGFDNPQGAMLV